MSTNPGHDGISAAREALTHGYQPIPIRDRTKRAHLPNWTHARHELATVEERFQEYADDGASNIGLLLGARSGGLIDVDLDHHLASRVRDYYLPPTAMVSGRPGRPRSHFWYRVDDDPLPGTRPHKFPDGTMIIEFRSTGGQTLIPPSIHETGEQYRWEGEPWGGDEGPAEVNGRALQIQVAMVALTANLLREWPSKGSRHEAYLALAGGLLRYGRSGVHPYWEKNLPTLISVLAEVTHDSDGARARVAEVMGTTVGKLRDEEDAKVTGFPKLASIIGDEYVEKVRRLARDIEGIGWRPGEEERPRYQEWVEQEFADLPEARDPLDIGPGGRATGWSMIDMERYILGEFPVAEPEILERSDGVCLMYPGLVNSLYGVSESAKSWIALYAGQQEMVKGGRVLYIDFEDGPDLVIDRLTRMGTGEDEMRRNFGYIHAEGPLAMMEVNNWGKSEPTQQGIENQQGFLDSLDSFQPNLVIVDGMSMLYALHDLNPNGNVDTTRIARWLTTLTDRGRRTVVLIDHTNKGAKVGAQATGSEQKKGQVSGISLQVVVETRPVEGRIGELTVYIGKDRRSKVVKHCTDEPVPKAATVLMDSTRPDETVITVNPPPAPGKTIAPSAQVLNKAARAQKKTETNDPLWQTVAQDIVDYWPSDEDGWIAKSTVYGLIKRKCSDGVLRQSLSALVKEGRLREMGTTSNKRWQWVR